MSDQPPITTAPRPPMTRERSLLLRLRAEIDEVIAEPVVTRSELALARDLDDILTKEGL